MYFVRGHQSVGQEGNPRPQGSVSTEQPSNVGKLNINHFNTAPQLDQTTGQALECQGIKSRSEDQQFSVFVKKIFL